MTPRNDPNQVLAFGQFFGDRQSALEVRGFELAHLSPTVPEREVVTVRDAPDLCTAPTVIYNPPGTTHRDRFRTSGGRFFTISVAEAALRSALEWTTLPDSALVLPHSLVELARRVARESVSPDGSSPLAAEAFCLELLARTSWSFDREPPSSPGWLRRARELLRDSFEDDLSLAEIAAAVGVHPVHLTRTFRRHFRCTPGEYLRRCRLEKAASLLAESAAPLSEMALASGFADQSHLAKSFKRAFGMTPSGLSKGHRN